jgi:hypothetical protein
VNKVGWILVNHHSQTITAWTSSFTRSRPLSWTSTGFSTSLIWPVLGSSCLMASPPSSDLFWRPSSMGKLPIYSHLFRCLDGAAHTRFRPSACQR